LFRANNRGTNKFAGPLKNAVETGRVRAQQSCGKNAVLRMQEPFQSPNGLCAPEGERNASQIQRVEEELVELEEQQLEEQRFEEEQLQQEEITLAEAARASGRIFA
jgi:hypothetical protein